MIQNINVDPAKALGLLAETNKRILSSIKKDNPNFVNQLDAFLKMPSKKINEFLGVVSNEIVAKVSDFFGHRVEGQVSQWMSDTFLSKVFNPCKDMEIYIGEVLPTLNKYVLSKNMDDTTIQGNTGSKPMSLEEYWLARYILLIKGGADKSKVYIFYVQVENKVLALDLDWDGDEWTSLDYGFNRGYVWSAGDVFVSLP